MRVRLFLLALLAASLVSGACRKRPAEPPQGPITNDAPPVDAGSPISLTVEVGQPIDLHGREVGPDQLEPTSDGGFVALEGAGRNTEVIRRIAPDGSVGGEFVLQSFPMRAIVPIRLDDVAVVGTSVWVTIGWERELVLADVRLTRDPSLPRPELLLVELDLKTGALRSHRRFDKSWGVDAKLAHDGDELYLLSYVADSDGKPEGSRERDQRIARLDATGAPVWVVDSETLEPARTGRLSASSCCVMVLADLRGDVWIGDRHLDAPSVGSNAHWGAVFSDDGRLLDARVLTAPGNGGLTNALLDGSTIQYSVTGDWEILAEDWLVLTTPGGEARRIAVECDAPGCAVFHLAIVDAGILAVIGNPKGLYARLYRADGSLLASTRFAFQHGELFARRLQDGVDLYFDDPLAKHGPVRVSIRVSSDTPPVDPGHLQPLRDN